MPTQFTPYSSDVLPDANGVRIVRSDLPAVADAFSYQLVLTEGDLVSLLADIRAEQLGLTADRTSGL